MMKRCETLIVVAALAAVSYFGASAQESSKLSVAEIRKFNLDALRTLESYEDVSAVRDEGGRMDFEALFKSAGIAIFNDLNGLSAAETLSVSDYAELMQTYARSPFVIIRNLKKGDPYFDNDEWKMDVSFDKSIDFTNECEVLFSSRTSYGEDIHLRGTLVWDRDSRECRFERLEGDAIERLPQDYRIYNQTEDARDSLLRFDGNPLRYNEFGQAYLPSKGRFVYPDEDVVLEEVVLSKDCHIVEIKYHPKRWRIKAHYDMPLIDSYDVSGIEDTKTTSTEVGVDLGYIIPSFSKVKWGIFFGVAMSQISLDMAQASLSYSYNAGANADIDGDAYQRYYEVKNLRQTLKSTDLAFPVYWDMDIRFSPYFSMYFDLGAKAYLNLKSEVSGISGTYSTYGYYEDYNLWMRPEDVWAKDPINGFVTQASLRDEMVEMNEPSKISVDALGRLGFRVKLYKDLYLDIAGSYQFSVMSPFSTESNRLVSLDYDTRNTPMHADKALISYTTKEGERIRPLYESSDALRRRIMNLNIGLMYRF